MENTETTNADKTPRQRKAWSLSLRDRLLLPFLVTLLLLTIITASSAIGLFRKTITLSVDDRLQAAQEIVYREFKKQETILQTYTVFLQRFQSLINRYPDDTEVGVLQDKLFSTLAKSDITVSFFPVDSEDILPIESLQSLFEQARRSKSPRFRYMKDFTDLPVLMVAAPLYTNDEIVQIMLLQTPMGGAFLQKITEPLGASASLHDMEGNILAESVHHTTPLPLEEKHLLAIGRGEQLRLNHEGDSYHRHLLSAIPLGTSDLVFLSLEAELQENKPFMQSLYLQMGIGVLGAMLIGLLLYVKTINSIVRPIRDIQDAVDNVNHGNLASRIRTGISGELGALARSFNRMLESLDDICKSSRQATPVDDSLTQQHTRTQLLLAKKEREIAELTEAYKTHERETAALLQLNQAMISSLDLNILFERILQVLNEVLICDHIVLLLHNPGEQILEVAHTKGVEPGALDQVRFTFDQGFCGKVAQERRLLYVGNVESNERHLSYHGQLVTRGSIVSAPLIVHDRLIGVLNLHKHDTDAFSTSELKLIQASANQAAIAIDNTELFEKAKDTVNTDTLTGLFNRRFFQDSLKREAAQARRFHTNFSTIMCDVDLFSKFCAQHGKMRGDALLKEIGQVLLQTTRGIDMASRFSNKQFVILLPKTDKAGAVLAAEKLRLAIYKEDFTGAAESQPDGKLTMSFGVTEFPADSQNIYELLNLADRALFHAKQRGRNITVAWAPELDGDENHEE